MREVGIAGPPPIASPSSLRSRKSRRGRRRRLRPGSARNSQSVRPRISDRHSRRAPRRQIVLPSRMTRRAPPPPREAIAPARISSSWAAPSSPPPDPRAASRRHRRRNRRRKIISSAKIRTLEIYRALSLTTVQAADKLVFLLPGENLNGTDSRHIARR